MQFAQLKRREFVTFLGGSAVWPLAARAQQPVMPIVGLINNRSAQDAARNAAAPKASTKPATSKARTSRWSTTG
jgi:hypothetical protein